MTSFEDRLWAELASEHATELAPGKAPHGQRPKRGLPITAGALALAGAVLATVAALTASPGTQANAVTKNSDGTVTVTIRELVGVKDANTELAALGISARAAAIEASCTTDLSDFERVPIPPDIASYLIAVGKRTRGTTPITITPTAIPDGDTLLLLAREIGPGTITLGESLYRGAVPQCIPASAANGGDAGATP